MGKEKGRNSVSIVPIRGGVNGESRAFSRASTSAAKAVGRAHHEAGLKPCSTLDHVARADPLGDKTNPVSGQKQS